MSLCYERKLCDLSAKYVPIRDIPSKTVKLRNKNTVLLSSF